VQMILTSELDIRNLRPVKRRTPVTYISERFFLLPHVEPPVTRIRFYLDTTSALDGSRC
jgi:hypothetical protein